MMVLKVVPLAKLLSHAHFPFNEDPSQNPFPRGRDLLSTERSLNMVVSQHAKLKYYSFL